jgi:hypothetical protein
MDCPYCALEASDPDTTLVGTAGALAGKKSGRMSVKPTSRPWVTAGLPPGAHDALTRGLPGSRLWSLLLDVVEARASERRPAELLEQWDRDRFVQPAIVDQRTLIEVDGHLMGAAPAFESMELSPVAPLGVCAIMGHASQNKVLSALRGTEVVSDPTNVMALECARRLRRDPTTVVRLATSHRCVRAQPIPKRRGLTANFRIFCLASAAIERQNHGFVVEAIAEHIATMLHALDRLEHHGFEFPERRITVLAREDTVALGDRIVAMLEGVSAARGVLEHPYYNKGLRFQIAARSDEGIEIPLIDGGAFDWVAKLTSNRRAAYVATGFGSQLVPLMFRHGNRPR